MEVQGLRRATDVIRALKVVMWLESVGVGESLNGVRVCLCERLGTKGPDGWLNDCIKVSPIPFSFSNRPICFFPGLLVTLTTSSGTLYPWFILYICG